MVNRQNLLMRRRTFSFSSSEDQTAEVGFVVALDAHFALFRFVAATRYYQVPIKRPPLINFSIFTLLGPPFVSHQEDEVVYHPLNLFSLFLRAIHAHFSKQNSVLVYIFEFYAL